ncbi:MAG: PAS domain S-box protein [Candidatus Cyclobacteriaceae bacterium M2_1C_046]
MHKESANMQILVIEDNIGDFILIEDYLIEELPGVKIDHVTTFGAAKDILTDEKKYDAILLDLSLPDNSGEKLVKEIVELVDTEPIIVLTGFADKEFSIRTLSMGISDYLLKDELASSFLYKSITYSIERKRVNHQIKESEEKYRALFNFSPQPMWVYDFFTLKFLNINQAAIEHYGYTREEFLNMTIKDIRPEQDIPYLEKALEIQERQTSYNAGVFKHLKKNGEIIEVDIKSTLVDFQDRSARLVVATDVSERMEYIREIEKQNETLHDIAWTQSHVVRAPLARIMGLINILKSEQENDEIKNYSVVINHILDSAHELDKIVRGIVQKTHSVEKEMNK